MMVPLRKCRDDNCLTQMEQSQWRRRDSVYVQIPQQQQWDFRPRLNDSFLGWVWQVLVYAWVHFKWFSRYFIITSVLCLLIVAGELVYDKHCHDPEWFQQKWIEFKDGLKAAVEWIASPC